MKRRCCHLLLHFAGLLWLSGTGAVAAQQPVPSLPREFHPGDVVRSDDLPLGRLRSRIEGLPATARARAVAWLGGFHFTEHDLETLQADAEGGIFYEDPAPIVAEAAVAESEPVVAAAALPVAPFPAALVFHSRPGAPNVLYLNFAGENVAGTAWNNSLDRTAIPATAFSSDADFATFSDSEQAVIKRVWQRVAEDYAAFDIDVTTERPATFNSRTAMALITRSTDTNGEANPSSSAGGVAYVNVFGGGSYSSYRPAWIYADNLGHNEAFIAEAASHEIGHNLGLSHDGKTDGSDYYGGHGSGETSWGPIMGTGYNRNVSQWSKGDYYLANNTQDDLAVIAGKISYRGDDHGSTLAGATALVLTGGTNIVSTTPETDPANAAPTNKGVLERTTDTDLFSFVTGSGTVSLAVTPWISPANTRGGDVDVQLELLDESGTLVASTNPPSQTGARLTVNVPEGVYFLRVGNVGTGDPLAASPSGYSAYGGVGQFFVNGSVVASDYVAPPQAEAGLTGLTQTGVGAHGFTVTYTDNLSVDVSTLDGADLRITGPNGYDRMATLAGVDVLADGTPRVATYSAPAPNDEVWGMADNGVYTVTLLAGAVLDTEGAGVAGQTLGQFTVAVPNAVYFANMDTDPGWGLGGQWQYGEPNYPGSGPTAGHSGSRIIAYNLSGNYGNNLATVYATTPVIDCGNATALTLRFRRWLQLSNRDTARVEVSTNGTSWTTLWSTSSSVSDSSWQEIQYALPGWTFGSRTVRIRWGLGSNQNGNAIGWNLDDVEILSGGALDTTPPSAVLSVADVVAGGSPSHSFSVTYSDDTAVSVATLGAGDLVVTGPNGYSNLVEFAGVDTLPDGSPRTASYSAPAPDGVWDVADNGAYTITLLDGEVSDAFNNFLPETVLGTFTVAIPQPVPALVVSPTVLTVAEGSNASVNIRLSLEPASPVTVVFVPTTESSAFTLSGAATNTLDGSNWSSGFDVVLAAGPDADQDDDEAIFVVQAAGTTPVSVFVTADDTTPDYILSVVPNQTNWGTVTPSGGLYPYGATVELTATPALYYRFIGWSGDVAGSANPLSVVVHSNLTALAEFEALTTTNHPTPHWWLVAHGATGDFETAVDTVGANGRPLWESYVAGLDPQDPDSRLELGVSFDAGSGSLLLSWVPVEGRIYTLWAGTNVTALVSGAATNAPVSISYAGGSNSVPATAPQEFFRLRVSLP